MTKTYEKQSLQLLDFILDIFNFRYDWNTT